MRVLRFEGWIITKIVGSADARRFACARVYACWLQYIYTVLSFPKRCQLGASLLLIIRLHEYSKGVLLLMVAAHVCGAYSKTVLFRINTVQRKTRCVVGNKCSSY